MVVCGERAVKRQRNVKNLGFLPSPLRISFPKPIANAPQVERYVSWASWFIIKAGGRMVKRRSKYSQIVIITSSPHTKSLNGGGVGLGNIAVHLKIGERAADGRGTTYGPHSSAVQLSLRACFFSLAEATATAKMSEGSRERGERWEIGRSPQRRRRTLRRRAGTVHRPSGLHTHFRSLLGHEDEVLLTKKWFVVDRNRIDFCARYFLDF